MSKPYPFPVTRGSAWLSSEDITSLIDRDNVLGALMGTAIRAQKPRYYNDTDGGTTVTVPASTTAPIYFFINSTIYEVTSDLTCDVSTDLDTGSIAANTPYYLYGVEDSGTVKVIASATAPTSGPADYSSWTYIGACATSKSSATIKLFQAVNGIYQAGDEIEVQSASAGSGLTKLTYSSCPVTAISMYGQLIANADGSASSDNQTVVISSSSGGEDTVTLRTNVSSSGNGVDTYVNAWVPFNEEQGAVWALPRSNVAADYQLQGWQENPMEYQ